MVEPPERGQLVEVVIGDEPDAWNEAGFAVVDGATVVGRTRLVFVGAVAGRGLRSVSLVGLDGPELAGLVLAPPGRPAGPRPDGPHPNGVVALDHLVLVTGDGDAVSSALDAAGLGLRRRREGPDGAGAIRRQWFHRFGDVIAEVVADDRLGTDATARPWGLAFTCTDLEALAPAGVPVGRVRPAVQEGRRICSLHGRDLGVTVPVAFLSVP